MLAGQLIERVTLLRREAARDALGGAAGAWRETGSVWARSRPARATAIEGDAVRGLRRWVVTVRPCDVAVGDRLRRVDGELAVLAVTRDPAAPDRLTLATEEVR